VNDRTVRTTAETKFNRGSATDLRNDAKVEISGRLDTQGVIVATKVKFDKDHDDDDDDDDKDDDKN
jgi:alpha-galactosidase/6-phospho-beta-glucosidase family protein